MDLCDVLKKVYEVGKSGKLIPWLQIETMQNSLSEYLDAYAEFYNDDVRQLWKEIKDFLHTLKDHDEV